MFGQLWARPFLVGDKVQNTKFEFFFLGDIWRNFVSPICRTNFHVFFVSEGPDKVGKKKTDFYFLFSSPQGTIEREKVNKNSNFVLCFCTPTRNALQQSNSIPSISIPNHNHDHYSILQLTEIKSADSLEYIAVTARVQSVRA